MWVNNYSEYNKEVSQDDSHVEHKKEPKEEKKKRCIFHEFESLISTNSDTIESFTPSIDSISREEAEIVWR